MGQHVLVCMAHGALEYWRMNIRFLLLLRMRMSITMDNNMSKPLVSAYSVIHSLTLVLRKHLEIFGFECPWFIQSEVEGSVTNHYISMAGRFDLKVCVNCLQEILHGVMIHYSPFPGNTHISAHLLRFIRHSLYDFVMYPFLYLRSSTPSALSCCRRIWIPLIPMLTLRLCNR